MQPLKLLLVLSMDPKVVYSLSNTSAIAIGVSGVKLVVATATSSCDITLQYTRQGAGAREVCACDAILIVLHI